MDSLATLQSMGLSLPSPAYLLGSVLFGLLGYAAWRRGRTLGRAPLTWGGVALMVYPAAVDNTLLLWLVGAALSAFLALRWK
jgi:hypothetical protein